jgi:hypothetical protein
MENIIGNLEIFEEVGRMGFDEIFDERINTATIADDLTVDEVLNNLHEDNAFHVFLDDLQRENNMFDYFESLINNAG